MMRHVMRITLPGILASLFLLLPIGISAERIHIGDVSMSPLKEGRSTYTGISSIVGRFDLVAAEEIRDAGSMEKVLAGMDENWEAAMSRRGFFGFLYNGRVQLVKDLGTYPGAQFSQPPYGAQFRLSGTRFAFNLVACHGETGKDDSRFSAAYRHFEQLTGNHGITILLAGNGLIIASPALRSRLAKSGTDSVVLTQGK